jgi:hypothetical protein
LEGVSDSARQITNLTAALGKLEQQSKEKEEQLCKIGQDLHETRQDLHKTRQDLDKMRRDLQLYEKDIQIIRQGVFETYIRERKNKASNSRKSRFREPTLDNEVISQRNRIAHGGHVVYDVKVIDQIVAKHHDHAVVEMWKSTFRDIYGCEHGKIHDRISSMPSDIVRAIDIRADTALHKNLNRSKGKVRFSGALRKSLRDKSQGILDDWIENPVDELDPKMVARCSDLAEAYRT